MFLGVIFMACYWTWSTCALLPLLVCKWVCYQNATIRNDNAKDMTSLKFIPVVGVGCWWNVEPALPIYKGRIFFFFSPFLFPILRREVPWQTFYDVFLGSLSHSAWEVHGCRLLGGPERCCLAEVSEKSPQEAFGGLGGQPVCRVTGVLEGRVGGGEELVIYMVCDGFDRK